MSGGYRPLPEDDLARLVQDIDKIRSDIRQLQMPTGTQVAEATSKLSTTVTNSKRETGFAMGGAISDVVIDSLTVPENCHNAVVILSVLGGCSNPAGSGSFAVLRLQTKIQALLDGPVLVDVVGGRYGSLSMATSATLSGLNPGDTITVAASMSFAGTAANTFAATTTTAIFSP